MSKTNWQYYFARKFSAHRYEVVMSISFSSFYQKHFQVKLKNILVVPAGKNHAIYFDQAEWPAAQQKIYQVVCQNWRSFQKYQRLIQWAQNEFFMGTRKIFRQVSDQASNKSLLSLHQLAVKLNHKFFQRSIWIPFVIEPFLAVAAEEEIKKLASGDEEKFKKIFNFVFSPEEKNAITRERESLLKVADLVQKGGAKEKLLQKHCQNFRWIPCYDPGDEPWEIDYFRQELNKIIDSSTAPTEELKKLRDNFFQRRSEFDKFLLLTKLTRRQNNLLRMAHALCFIKDQRDDFRRLGSFYLQSLYQEIGRRAGLDLKEVVNLLNDEIEEFLVIGQLPDMREIRQRQDGYVLWRQNDHEIKIFSGRRAHKIVEQELSSQADKKASELKGIIGNQGRASGSVQIVISKHDLRKVKPGDVMVAITTHPDFVPAMRRAVAIVTDEGGITSHAAIVSREINIPCLVGTKEATRAFRDGQEVEVDADQGIVRKLT
ncbi:hypothetical protein KJ903_05740 [Patescibacteria group bacterium]|nr:hypothetical protein [Patescibacteria group bacterium]